MPGPEHITAGSNLPGIPSEGWNAFVDMHRRFMGGGGPGNGSGQSSGARRLTALVKNNSGAAIDVVFGVVELDGPVFNSDDRETVVYEGIAFKGIEPDAETRAKDVAIYQGQVGDGQSGEAVISGPTWVRLELPEWDQTYTTAKATDGDCTKLTASGAIPVLWHATPEEATPPDEQETEVWALVMLGGGGSSNLRKARVTTAITAATDELEANWGTGEVKFMDDTTGVLDSDPTTVDNDNIDMTFAEDAQVIVDTSHSPPRVITGTCSAVTWS